MFRYPPRLLSRLEIDPHADVASEKPGKGRKLELVDCTEQAKVIYHSLESGNTISTSTILLKECFRKPPKLRYRRIQPWLIDHVISESTHLYAGSEHADTFQIFHDDLTAWWEPAAQSYIAGKGFKDRQLRSLGPTIKGTRHEGKLQESLRRSVGAWIALASRICRILLGCTQR
jgi:hypothetical protein